MAQIPIALQMYTLRGETGRDFAGTLREVAKIGYAGVEFAGTGGLSAPALRGLLQDLNLRVAGSHTGLEVLETDLNSALDFNQEIGMEWPAIFAAAEAGGARWYIVEQDTCLRPPLESVALSLRNLRAMGKA
jgi:sugar phosphate isomerase/epimerase